MESAGPRHLSIDECVDLIVDEFGPDIRFCAPLGLGKSAPLMNALYRRVKADPNSRHPTPSGNDSYLRNAAVHGIPFHR